jgi:hypothetical protein
VLESRAAARHRHRLGRVVTRVQTRSGSSACRKPGLTQPRKKLRSDGRRTDGSSSGASSKSLSGRRPRSLSARQGVPGMGRRCRCRRRRRRTRPQGRECHHAPHNGLRRCCRRQRMAAHVASLGSAPAKKGHILTCQGADVSIGRKQREETALDLVTGLENRCCGDEPSSGVGHSASSGLHVAGPLDGEQAQGTSRSPRPDFRGRPA